LVTRFQTLFEAEVDLIGLPTWITILTKARNGYRIRASGWDCSTRTL